MKNNKYNNFWFVFIQIKAKDGFEFNELIDKQNENEIQPRLVSSLTFLSSTIINHQFADEYHFFSSYMH